MAGERSLPCFARVSRVLVFSVAPPEGHVMPGFLLHEGAVVLCSHAGQAQPTVPVPTVLVSGQPIVTIACPYVVAGCALPPPPAANGPCVTGTFVTASLNVMSFGQPVLLMDSMSVCVTSGTPLLIVETQVLASGM
jgi:hypothetical protein